MICFPNAKINIGLKILKQREDGYHDLSSLFVGVNWCDALEVIENNVDVLYIDNHLQNIEYDRSNLVIKALDLTRFYYKIPPVKIHLLKKIPMGAGLGGGSSDASFMIRTLNDKFDLKISIETQLDLAAKLGSDCPFFIHNNLSLVSGRGEIIEPLNINPLKGKKIVLINPGIHISTKEAFENVFKSGEEINIDRFIDLPLSEWQKYGVNNDFEIGLFKKFKVLNEIKSTLKNSGSSFSSMSGSGSTIFGIFEKSIPEMIWQNNYLVHHGEIL